LAAMGVVGLRAPEAAGGLGLTDLDLVLLLEETGRAALPGPVVEHVAVAVPMLAELGWDDWLGRAVAGDALVTVAVEPWAYVVAGPQADLVLFHQDGRLHTGAEAWDPVVSVDRSRRLAEPRGLSPASHDAPDWAAACDRGALGTAAQLCGVAAHLIDVTVAYACERRQFGVPIGSQDRKSTRLNSSH